MAAAINADSGEVKAYLEDVSEADAARACVEAAVPRFGSLDVLLKHAAIFLAPGEDGSDSTRNTLPASQGDIAFEPFP